jgi:cytosolic iron-sulfur protein assembly protein CIAO1
VRSLLKLGCDCRWWCLFHVCHCENIRVQASSFATFGCCSGTILASCSGDRTICLWDPACVGGNAPQCIATLGDAHTKTIRSVSWSPGGALLVSASFDGTTAIWRKAGSTWQQVRTCRPVRPIWTGRCNLGEVRTIECGMQTAVLEGHENEVKCAAFASSGTLLATCGRDKTVWVWESFPGDDFECADVKYGHSQDVKMVAWHPSSEVLVSASYDNTLKLWKEDPDGSEWYVLQAEPGLSPFHARSPWAVRARYESLPIHRVLRSQRIMAKQELRPNTGRHRAWSQVHCLERWIQCSRNLAS